MSAAQLRQIAAVADNLDQQTALDRAEQGRACQCQITLEVGNAFVEIANGSSIGDRSFNDPTSAPFGTRSATRSIDADRDAALDGMPDASHLQRNDPGPERNEVVARRGVLEENNSGQQQDRVDLQDPATR